MYALQKRVHSSRRETVMRSNIEDVARRAGVSIATVSRTFKHPELVAPATRDKVSKAASDLDFSISRSAAVFQTGQSFRIALLINGPWSTWFNTHMFEGLDSVFHPAGYDIAIYPIGTRHDRHDFFENLPIRRNADAVVIASFDVDPTEARHLHNINLPLIGVNALPEDALSFSISIDDEEGMRLATRHLIMLNHTNIVFISYTPLTKDGSALRYSAMRRLKGFRQECLDSGITPTVIEIPDDHTAIDSALTQLFALKRMPSAICCQQDSIAVPLMTRLQRFGYSIPDNISIVGFDDSLYADQIGLTTVHQDPGAMGVIAAQRTLELIAGRQVEPTTQRVDPGIMFRSSTGPYKPR